MVILLAYIIELDDQGIVSSCNFFVCLAEIWKPRAR